MNDVTSKEKHGAAARSADATKPKKARANDKAFGKSAGKRHKTMAAAKSDSGNTRKSKAAEGTPAKSDDGSVAAGSGEIALDPNYRRSSARRGRPLRGCTRIQRSTPIWPTARPRKLIARLSCARATASAS